MSLQCYELRKLTPSIDRTNFITMLQSLRQATDDAIQKIDKLEKRLNDVEEEAKRTNLKFDDMQTVSFGKNLEQYVNINDLNQLVADIEENLNTLSNSTPRDISSLKQQIEDLRNELKNSQPELKTVESITVRESDLKDTKSEMKMIPKITIQKKK